ncbi:MAG: ETC complex I subunit [Rhodobacteraceae bacterium]|nr:ETC complex I subunit [Paracoccaceae bacterium]
MLARIYQPARNAMTSGQAKTKNWVLEFSPQEPRQIDPLMGWTGSGDMNSQIRLMFDSKDAAVDYASSNGIPYTIVDPKNRKQNVRSGGYGDNFATNRRAVWTH